MSQVNDTNYTNATPVASDYTIFVRDSDSVIKTATMQQLADLFASLASLNLSVTVIDSTTTLTTEQLVVGNSGSAFDINLPASSLNTGRRYRIFNKASGLVTVLPSGSDTIANQASVSIAQYATIEVTSDGLGMWSLLT